MGLQPPSPAAIYVRGPPRILNTRLVRCEKLSVQLGLSVVRQFRELEPPSRTRVAERPAYRQMLECARRGDFGVLIVDDLTDLWSIPEDLRDGPSELEALKIQLVAFTGEDTRRDGWKPMLQTYLAARRERRAAMRSATNEIAQELDGLKKTLS